LRSALSTSGRGATGAAGGLRSTFVVAQVGLSLVLLTGAGLLLRSFQLLSAVDPGYRAAHVLVMDATYPASDDAGARQGTAYFASLLRATRALPGVDSVSVAGGLPIDEGSSDGLFQIEGRGNPAPADSARQQAQWRIVGPGYFSTLGIRLLRGREFDDRDVAAGTPTVLVNETLARAAWPGEDPVGHRIRIGWDSTNPPWMTIVGVVADTRQISLDAPVEAELYVPFAQHPQIATELKVIARTRGEPTALTEAFRRTSLQLDAEVPVKFTTAELLIADTLTAPRFRTLLIGVFATVAVLLAVIGVASVLVFVVTERRREIGVRLAIGAPRHRILALVLGNGLKLVLAGVVLGLAGAAAASRFLQSLLFNVPALDPLVYAGVSLLLLAVAALACLVPAFIATTVDPMTVIRSE
jgi:predicted permease